MNPFNGLQEMINFVDKYPKEGEARLMALAKQGIDPPPFSNPEEFVALFSQSQGASQNKPPEALQGFGNSVPQMPPPDELNMLLAGHAGR